MKLPCVTNSSSTRQVIIKPRNLRLKIVTLSHNAHLGADSCIRRARESIFWPGMSADIKAAVYKSETCAMAGPSQQTEPLQQPEMAMRAWSRVSVDIMTLDGRDYLVTVDSLSSYFEVDLLTSKAADQYHIEAENDICTFWPDVLVRDSGPQFPLTNLQILEGTGDLNIEQLLHTTQAAMGRLKQQSRSLKTCGRQNVRGVMYGLLDYRNMAANHNRLVASPGDAAKEKPYRCSPTVT